MHFESLFQMMDGKFIDGQEVHVSLSQPEVALKRIGPKFNVRVDSNQGPLPGFCHFVPFWSCLAHEALQLEYDYLDDCMRSIPSAHIMNSMNRRTGVEPSTTYFGNIQVF